MEVRNLEISGIVKGGRGLARTDTGPVFVEGALPGELVRAEITERKRSWASARTLEVLRPATERTPAPCPYYGECGGCDWQHIRYPSQVQFKEQILAECLSRIARISLPLRKSITGSAFGYRWRVRLRTDDRGQVGFFRRRSRALIPVDRCLILTPHLNQIVRRFGACRTLLPRDAEISLSQGAQGVVALVSRNLRGTPRELLEATGLSGCTIRGGACHGEGHSRLELEGLGFIIRPGGFFQANWELNHELARAVALSVPQNAEVLDLYSGAGNFALYLAARGCSVTAVEGDQTLIADGRKNARDNGLNGVRFLRRNLSGRAADLNRERLREINVLVMDPPRGGAHLGLTDWILGRRFPSIRYVSCDPATLARDLSRLEKGYRLVGIQVIDLFPQTSHIESLAFLERS